MRQRSSLDDLYAAARRRAGAATDDTGAPRPPPDACPFGLDDLLAGDLTELTAKLDGSPA